MIKTYSRVEQIISRLNLDDQDFAKVLFKRGNSYYPLKFRHERWGYLTKRHIYVDDPNLPNFSLHYIDDCYFAIKNQGIFRIYDPATSPIIIEEKDLEDFYIITYTKSGQLIPYINTAGKESPLSPGMVCIFHNWKLSMTLKNVDLLSVYEGMDRYNFSFSDISFIKILNYSPCDIQHHHWNGICFEDIPLPTITETTSFHDWCQITGNRLLGFYSRLNPISGYSPDLLWTSQENVKWTCSHGHTWEKRICDYTKAPPKRFHECPICEHIKKVTNPKDLKKEIKALLQKIEAGEIFVPGYEKHSANIQFTFRYPYGKYSDIAMYLARTEGHLVQHSFNTYSLTYSSNSIQQIMCMYFCLDSMQYGHSQEDFICDYTQAEEYLSKYCRYFILGDFLSKLSLFPEPYDKNSFSQQCGQFYRNCLKKEREKVRAIYDKMIRSGENVGRWKSERELFALVSSQYPDAIFQYKTKWLGQQSLDIFVPSLNIGIEFQGAQHYEPVEFFGGQDALEERIDLDKRKKKLCIQNGIKLIEWKWTEAISLDMLHQKIVQIGV